MILAILRTIFFFALTVIIVTFALLNQSGVSFQYSPFHDAIEVPVFTLGLGGLGFGFFFGCLMVWLHSLKLYFEKRHLKKTIKTLEKQLEKKDITVEPINKNETVLERLSYEDQ